MISVGRLFGVTKIKRGLMRKLLEFAAGIKAAHSGPEESATQWKDVDDRQLRYVLDAGLAPLLYCAAQDTLGQVPAAWRDALQGADLTARVMYGNLRDATGEILDACRDQGVRVTLLKGISIGDQHYPAAHLRPMGDIDILVAVEDCAGVESMLLRRGYTRKAGYRPDEGAAHGAPMVHPERGVWVEVHTALFPEGDRLLGNRLFSPSQIARQTVASTFHDRPAYRLTREMQLAYVASYWIRDLAANTFHPSFVTPLLDALYLLRAPGPALDWEALLQWLDNDMATASLYVMLSYLATRGLDRSASPILERLAASQPIVGAPELRILCAMIDAHLVAGRPFLGQFGNRHPMIAQSVLNGLLATGSHVGKVLSLPWKVVFPPWIPGRYGARYQFGRLARFLRRRA